MQQPCPTIHHQKSSSQPQISHHSNSTPLPLRTHSPRAHVLLVDTQSAASLTQTPTPALSATTISAPTPNITFASGQSFIQQDQDRDGTPSASIVAAAAAKTPDSTTTPTGSVRPTLSCDTCMATKSNIAQHPSSHHPLCDVSPSAPAPPPAAATAALEEFDIVKHPVRDTLLIVSSLLSLLAHNNDSKHNPLVDPITLFHSRAVPRISIEAYLVRILQYIPFTNEVLLNVLVFLDRIGGLSGMEMNASGNVEARQANGIQDRTDGLFGNTVACRSLATTSASSLALAPTSIPCSSQTTSPRSLTGESASASYIVSTCANVSLPLHSSYIHSPPPPPPPPPHSSSSAGTTPYFLARVSSSSSFESSSKISSDPDLSNNNHNTSSNLNSDLPMIQKRGREEENLEKKEIAGTNVFHQQQEQQSSKQQQQQQQPQPLYANSIPQHSNPLQSQQHAEEEADLQRALKRTKLEAAPSSTSSSAATSATQHVQASTTIDAQSTPGGSTPAPTPQLAVASNGLRINSFNIHRLLITCLMVAAKFTSDLFYSNARYAKVGGLSLLELNQLELEFLFTTRFELNVKVEELQRVGNALLRFKARKMTPVQQAPLPEQRHHQHQQELLSLIQPQQQTSVTVAINTQHGNVINTVTAKAAATAPSGGSQTLQQKTGRFSIPSPTSPRNGPMSDKSAPTPTSSSSFSSASSASSSASATVTTLTSAAASASSSSTVIVLSRARSQRPQLLSPPEEKHRWAETDVQMTGERIDQDQRPSASISSSVAESAPCPNPSSSSSSSSTSPP